MQTVNQLKAKAKVLKIPRYSRMRKAELVAAIEAHENYDPEDNSKKSYDLAVNVIHDRLASFRKEVIGDCTLYLGDCRQLLPLLPTFDAVITDPPYDARTHDGAITDGRSNGINFAPIADIPGLVGQLLEKCSGWCLAFCPMEDLAAYRDATWPHKAWVRAGFWDRIVNTPQFSGDRPAQGGEGIAIFHRYARKQWNGGGKAAIWRYAVERGAKEHPTQKPVRLISELVALFSSDGGRVLDPFMGAGTTGVACARLGRSFTGIELDPTHFETACRRISEAYKQGDFFVPRIVPPQVKQLGLLEAAE